MAIDHVLAVVPVSDIAKARDWYERLFGRAPDNEPMESLVEWRITDSAWLQVWLDRERAGSGLVNFAVDDLPAHRDELADRGIDAGETQDVNKGVRLSSLTDPDGNQITMIGNFRVHY
jgi:glyoxylase I family protein